jgi:hypothetical protein
MRYAGDRNPALGYSYETEKALQTGVKMARLPRITFWIADDKGFPVRCSVGNEALEDHARAFLLMTLIGLHWG